VIKENLKYPEKAVRNCCTGSVNVIFTIDEEGKIDIKNTFSDNPDVERIVREQLESICCKGIKTAYNEHFRITITFKIIG
jgi:outer membrane biosynthesis protein TonB